MSHLKKIFIILQLCLAFSYLVWLFVEPLVKSYVNTKYTQTLYQMVLEKEEYFSSLSWEDQKYLKDHELKSFREKKISYPKALGLMLTQKTSPYALAWLFFSLILTYMIMKQKENAPLLTWILPLLVIFYAFSLRQPAQHIKPSIFPKEEDIVARYIDPILDSGLSEREKLLKGWHLYLVTEIAHETPSPDDDLFQRQLDRGLYLFNVERLKWIFSGKEGENIFAGFYTPPSFLELFFYFFWNAGFAWVMNKKPKLNPGSIVS